MSGSYSRNKGASFEQRLAAYLRQWWPGARRAVAAGWKNATTEMADGGDIAGVPGVVWSAKSVAPSHSSKPSTWIGWWAELDAMLADDKAALGVIVEKRVGSSDVGASWAHLHLSDLLGVCGGLNGMPRTGERDRTPVRLRLDDLVGLLVASGYTHEVAS